MPEECASMRSIARWVLPVLVGPSTAVTPVPRARASRRGAVEKEMAIKGPGYSEEISLRRRSRPARLTTDGGETASIPCSLYHNATPATVIPHLCLSCGTSLERKVPESLTL